MNRRLTLLHLPHHTPAKNLKGKTAASSTSQQGGGGQPVLRDAKPKGTNIFKSKWVGA